MTRGVATPALPVELPGNDVQPADDRDRVREHTAPDHVRDKHQTF